MFEKIWLNEGSMTNIDTIENKISAVIRYLTILENYKNISKEELEKDITLRGAVERYLYLAVQSTIDLAEAVISFNNFRKPGVLSESFHILREEQKIPSSLTDELVKMVGFRNIVAHDYENVNYDIVFDILNHKLSDIEEFLDIITPK